MIRWISLYSWRPVLIKGQGMVKEQWVKYLNVGIGKRLLSRPVGVVALLLACLPFGALAANSCSTPSLPSDYPFPPIKISASDLNVGDEIPGGSSVAHYNITCIETVGAGNYWQLREWPAGSTTTTSLANVYSDTALPSGIGYMVKDRAGNPVPFTFSKGVWGFNIQSAAGFKTGDVAYTLTLVKTGALPSTEKAFSFPLILSVPGISWANQPATGNDPSKSIRTFSGTASSITKTCTTSADSENINVSLSAVTPLALVNVGDTAKRTSFSINIDCEPNSSISVGFTDATTITNESNALTLSTGSTATGIGVQLSSNGEPIMLSAQSTRQGTELQGSTTTTAQRLSFPVEAAYIKTADNVTTGAVGAKALFTIYYN